MWCQGEHCPCKPWESAPGVHIPGYRRCCRCQCVIKQVWEVVGQDEARRVLRDPKAPTPWLFDCGDRLCQHRFQRPHTHLTMVASG